MTIATILPTARTVFLDANSNPLSGGSVYFYIPSTLTPKTTWQDATGSTSNSNPVVLDANGSALIYGSGQYRQIVLDSLGNTVWDNLTQDTYGLVVGSNNTWTGTNTFTGAVSFSNSFAGVPNGGFINKFRNGTFDIWQRGTSGTITAGTPAYTADGWLVGCTGANNTWARGGSISGNSVTYSLQIIGAGSTADTFVKQRIESFVAAQLYQGVPVTIQILILNQSGATLTPSLTVNHANAVDNWGAFTTDVGPVNLQPILSGAAGTMAYTFQPNASTGNGLEVIIDFGGALSSGAKSVYVSTADIRLNPTATIGLNSSPPPIELRPISTELAFCQRYLPAFNSPSTLNSFGVGQCTTTTAGNAFFPFHVSTRTPVTGITISSAADFELREANGTLVALSALTLGSASNESVDLGFTVGSAVLTAGNATSLLCKSATGQVLFTGAEL